MSACSIVRVLKSIQSKHIGTADEHCLLELMIQEYGNLEQEDLFTDLTFFVAQRSFESREKLAKNLLDNGILPYEMDLLKASMQRSREESSPSPENQP